MKLNRWQTVLFGVGLVVATPVLLPLAILCVGLLYALFVVAALLGLAEVTVPRL